MEEPKEDFVTIYRSMGGWKAVLMGWGGGFWEPIQTWCTAPDRETAIDDAKSWADCEGIEFREPTDVDFG